MINFKQFEILREAAYAGNIGIMELIKFKKKANQKEKEEFDSHVKNKRNKQAWEVVQKVTGAKLHKSVHEEKKSPNSDILPVAGAGQWGTKHLVNKYKKETPGQ